MKNSQKRWAVGMGIITGFGALQLSSWYFLFKKKFDPTKEIIAGMDNSIFYFGGIFLSAVGGYMAGSVTGPLLYRSMRNMQIYDEMSNSFAKRIQKHRPQELHQVGAGDSIRHLDYYGERIDSVKDYKKWLRIQRDFKKTGKLPHRLFQ